MQTPWGLSGISWTSLRTDLLSSLLLQNTDLFEMIEKMQVRWLCSLFREATEWAGLGSGACYFSHPTLL